MILARFGFAASVIVLAACTPPAKKEEAPAAAPEVITQWEPADGPGASSLSWMGEGATITLSCIQKCDPKAKPKPDEPQPECVADHAAFVAVGPIPPGSAMAPGEASLLLGAAPVTAAKAGPVSEELPGDHLELTFKLDAGLIKALSEATNARIVKADSFVEGGQDTKGQFKQFAQSCQIHADAVK